MENLEFYKACENGNLDEVTKILARVKNKELKKELINQHLSTCSKKDIDIVKIDIFDNFFKACSSSIEKLDEVKKIFKIVKNPAEKKQLIDSEHSTGFTPLVIACYSKYYNTVHFLIKQGANINIQDADGYTPLMTACDGGDIDIVKLLLQNNANINILDNKGKNALFHAIRWNSNKPGFIEEVQNLFNQRKVVQTLGILEEKDKFLDADTSKLLTEFMDAKGKKTKRKKAKKNKPKISKKNKPK
jgi:hypothetical protein